MWTVTDVVVSAAEDPADGNPAMTDTSTPVDTDTLPPTQYLILEVLAARHRTGEVLWTFPSHLRPHMKKLAEAGMLGWKSGIVEKTVRAWLTDAGRAAVLLDGYEPPKHRDAAAVMSWDYREQPDLDDLARTVRDMTGGALNIREANTRSDQYAIVLSTAPLDETAADAVYDRWRKAMGGLGDIFPIDPPETVA